MARRLTRKDVKQHPSWTFPLELRLAADSWWFFDVCYPWFYAFYDFWYFRDRLQASLQFSLYIFRSFWVVGGFSCELIEIDLARLQKVFSNFSPRYVLRLGSKLLQIYLKYSVSIAWLLKILKMKINCWWFCIKNCPDCNYLPSR